MNPSAGVGFSPGAPSAPTSSAQNLASGFTFSSTVAQSTPIQNPPASTQPPTFGTFATTGLTTPAAPASGFPLLSSTATVVPTLIQTSSTAPSVTTAGLTFGTSSTPLAAKTTKTVSFNLSSPNTTAAQSSLRGILKGTTASTTTVSSTPSTVTSGFNDQSINYVQLQDLTNKWISDFEDLQKLLLNQTSETINRDITLAINEDKIEKLVNTVQNLKTEQTFVEQQLDFILSQQRDLEECLVSLEDEVSSYFPELPADDMYKLAENIDSRLKKTLETSKEIITKINDKNRLSENASNPMVAIGRILNHLTNSIQMLENMNAEGQTKLGDLQKMYQQYTA